MKIISEVKDKKIMNFGDRMFKGIAVGSKPTINGLIDIRKRAFRRGLWFRTLNTMQRGIFNLTIKYVAEIKSSILCRTLTKIYHSLSQAIQQGYFHRYFKAGIEAAEHLSNVAYAWGNFNAIKWKCEEAFIICLGMNKLSGWRYQET